MSICLFVCLSVQPSVYMYVCLYLYMPVCVLLQACACLPRVEQPSNMPCVLSQSVCHRTHSICAPDQLCVYGACETACTYADLTSQQQASSVIRALSQLAQDESICCWAHQLTVRACVQILTTQQQALSILTALPYSPDKLRMMEVLAARRKEPPGWVLAQPGDLDDFGHHGNWLQLVNHVKAVKRANLHVCLPLSVF